MADMSVAFVARQSRIIGSLMMREMTTRFGREGLGFVWLIAEPLAFCFGVMALWALTKPAYEHGVRLMPFVMTGYMSVILLRHQISLSASALQANIGLLYHRQITPLHLFLARNALEVAGTTIAFIIVYVVLIAMGEVGLPEDYLLLYAGWFLLAWIGMGLALIMAGLAMRFEPVERLVPLMTYILIPISGSFFMVSWLPAQYQEAYLYIPFPNAIEMIRAAVFGEFVETHYRPMYALTVGTIFNVLGMLMIASARDQIDVE